MSKPKIFRKSFVTPVVVATFPNLNKPDKFDNYSVDVDLLQHPGLADEIQAQADAVLAEAKEKLEVDKDPMNNLFRKGVIEKDGPRKGEEFFRASFKMKSERKVKDKKVKQRPRLVDAKRQPMSELIYGGSKLKIAYDIQYTLMPTGAAYLSLKLNAVQVIEHVGPGGEKAISDIFDEEEGFESSAATDAFEGNESDNETDSEESDGEPKKGGKYF